MKLLIFSDLDGTFMNHDDYSYSILKDFVYDIKDKHQIIFNSSKTFSEIKRINKDLKINFPFIVENGASIFFPKGYLIGNPIDYNLKNYQGYLRYSIAKKNINFWYKRIYEIRKKFKFNFFFFRELSDIKLQKIMGLEHKRIEEAKNRLFSEPLYWNDTDQNLNLFKKKVKPLAGLINIGGRFIHITDGYDKGVAIKQFLKLMKVNNKNEPFISVSLGDSHNDISMLELTDYSCIIKSKKKKNLYLKKKNNLYNSKSIAPLGWRESIKYILNKENKYF